VQGAHLRALSEKVTRRKAKKLAKEMAHILKHRGYRLKAPDRELLEQRLFALRTALAKDGDEFVYEAKKLYEAYKRHHEVLKKATFREFVESFGSAILIALLLRAFVIEAFKIPTGSMIPTLMVGDHIFVNKFIYGLRVPFTHRFMVRFSEPKRGDVAVFEFPGDGEDKGKDFIKRIVAVAGDKVRLRDNQLIINDEPVVSEVIAKDVPCDDESLAPCRCVRQRERLGEKTYITQHLAPPQPGDHVRCFDQRPDWPTDDPRMFGSKGTNGDYPEVKVPEGHVLTIGDNRDNSSDGRYWGFVPVDYIKGKAMFIWWPPGRWFRAVH
jgi:signal peptidase I